jgi:hypothetical protein
LGVDPNAVQLLDAIFGLLTLIFAGLMWIGSYNKRVRMANHVRIVLVGAGRRYTSGHVRCSMLTRAEIQGVIGLIPMARTGERYSIALLSDATFLDLVDEAVGGRGLELVIPVRESEWAQFKV